LARIFGRHFEIRVGGAIGKESLRLSGKVLTGEVIDFCREIWDEGGAILAGPGGGSFVYDMRRQFDLYFKLNPVVQFPELADAMRVKLPDKQGRDIVVVRDNVGGLYQGQSEVSPCGQNVTHRFGYSEQCVSRLLQVAAQIASRRGRRMTVVCKEGGLPDLTRLWFNTAERIAAEHQIQLCRMDIDFAAYQFVAQPEDFDVVAIPNCFGDILADLGGVLMGSRGITYGASYSPSGDGIYQTNHGAAYDLAGKDTANPTGQLLSLAMLLDESAGLREEAALIVSAVRKSWNEGWRTSDLMAPGCRLVGTKEMGEVVSRNIGALADARRPLETAAPAR
jgi:3-isopropylmalate dehydrogenase